MTEKSYCCPLGNDSSTCFLLALVRLRANRSACGSIFTAKLPFTFTVSAFVCLLECRTVLAVAFDASFLVNDPHARATAPAQSNVMSSRECMRRPIGQNVVGRAGFRSHIRRDA